MFTPHRIAHVKSLTIHRTASILACFVCIVAMASQARAGTGTAFTYQGLLKQSDSPVNGDVDLQFALFDAAAAGNQIGSTLALNAMTVSDGLFTASLDFGALAFDGNERWLEIAVRSPAGSANPFVTLAPRQRVDATPYAQFALNAALNGTYGGNVHFSNAANTFAGSFTGSGTGLTNLNPASMAAGTAGISISGNAATATSATTAGNVSGVVAIANGGTGANNATTARTNLGVAALSHTHAAGDIVSGTLDPARLPTGGAWSLSSNLIIDTDLLFINPTTNLVGVGTTTPGAPFDVQRTSSNNVINPLATFRSAGTGNSSGSLRTQNSAGNHWNFGVTQGGDFALNYNLNISQASDLLRFTSAGNMGVGTTAPAAKLHVNGDARIDGSIAIATTTRTKTISAAAFAPSSPITTAFAYTLGQTGLILSGGETAVFRASLELPDGATLLDIDMVIMDDSASQDMQVGAFRTPFDGTAAVSIGTGGTSSTAGTPQFINALTSPIVIDNVNNAYHVLASWTGPSGPTGGVLRLYAARFTYTIAQPLP